MEQENTTEEVDILKLNAHIAEIVIRQNKLRTAIDEIVADLEGGNLWKKNQIIPQLVGNSDKFKFFQPSNLSCWAWYIQLFGITEQLPAV